MNGLHTNPSVFRGRRGVAMLLVIICLAMATILATSYLASRDNSGAIGENVVDAAQARWASESGIELAVAVLETEANWRTDHVNGKLIDDMAVPGGALDVDLLDIETGEPPTDATDNVLITSMATANGITRTSKAVAFVAPDGGGDIVQVDLAEFAVFTAGGITMADTSTLTRWPMSPLAKEGRRVNLGVQATDALSVSVGASAAAIDSTIYHGPGASSYLIDDQSGSGVQTMAMDDFIPLPLPPAPGVLTPAEDSNTYAKIDVNSPTEFTTDHRFTDLVLTSGDGILTLTGDLTIVAETSLEMKANTGIVVDGDVSLVIFGNMTMTGKAFIELMPGASLTTYVFNQFDIEDAYIGNLRADRDVRDNTGTADWMDPRSVKVYTIPRLDPADPINQPAWSVAKNTVVKGTIYVPNAGVTVTDNSAIYGRLTAQSISLQKNGSVYYDHSLDSGTGFTNLTGGLYQDDGTVLQDVRSYLKSLSDSDLSALATNTGLEVKAGKKSYGSSGSSYVPPPTGTPSERPIEVKVRLVSVGADTQDWEVKASPVVSAAATLRQDTMDLASSVSSLDVLLFSGATLLQRLTNQNTFASTLDTAANQIGSGDYAGAITTLQGAYDKVDGDSSITDVMLDGADKTAAANEINRILTALQAL